MKSELKSKAIELRKEGKSVRTIAKLLLVAKSTVSLWVRGIMEPITPEESGPEMWSRIAANKRMNWKKEGIDRAKKDEPFRLVCALFWGEGGKTSENTLSISNSDKAMISFVYRWLTAEGYGSRISLMIQHHGNVDDVTVKVEWLKVIPVTRCWVSQNIAVSSKKKRGIIIPHGTACLRLHDTRLTMMVIGGIEYLRTMGR